MSLQRPALERGPMLAVAEPILGTEEKAALAEVIDSGWITMGPKVADFERAFAEAHGAPDAVAVSSCTAGLHLALAALGIGPGDEVLVPSLTFVATANSVLYTGATPVFVDVESLQHPLMSLEDAEAKCTKRTRAVILVHFGGYLCDHDLWRAWVGGRSLLLVEDAAHCAGLEGAGTIGDAAVFSFYGNKNMTTAEGGMIMAPSRSLRERMRAMRGHGLTSGTFERHKAGLPGYDVTMLGFNYRLDELRAAVGLAQLRRLRGWNERRRSLDQIYRRHLAECAPEVVVPFAADLPSSHHIMPILLPRGTERTQVIEALRAARIQTTIHYPPVHCTSFYAQSFPTAQLRLTEEFAGRELTLPLHPAMDDAQVEQVVAALAGALRE